MMQNSTQKSQVIVFTETGTILNSCNTLFNAGRLAGKNVFEIFPAMQCIKDIITNLKADNEPLFLPHIAFSTYKYRSICDFIFVKSEKKSGVQISWMLNDNSMHYKTVLHNVYASRKKSYGNYFSIENNAYLQRYAGR